MVVVGGACLLPQSLLRPLLSLARRLPSVTCQIRRLPTRSSSRYTRRCELSPCPPLLPTQSSGTQNPRPRSSQTVRGGCRNWPPGGFPEDPPPSLERTAAPSRPPRPSPPSRARPDKRRTLSLTLPQQ